MRTEQIVYKCDECGKEEIIQRNHFISDKWITVIMNHSSTDNLVKERFHFCSKSCAADFILIDGAE